MKRRDFITLNKSKHRIVIVGSGFGGMAFAKSLRKTYPKAQIVMLEKRDFFISCPLSNAYLGGLKKIDLDMLCRDFYETAKTLDYEFIHCEVIAIKRSKKTVYTTKGSIRYDYLVLAPGISYDYKKQFPNWSDSKIREVSQKAPAALITGNEHLALKRQLEEFEGGNIVITVPEGRYRCMTSPYERATMIANYLRKEHIKGKVILLDPAKKIGGDKEYAYIMAFEMLYRDIIEYYTDAKITDISLEDKTITARNKKIPFDLLNFIPMNRAHPLIQMAGISINEWGGAIMKGAGFRSIDDDNIYIIGDAMGHKIPASAQIANWSGNRAGEHLGKRIQGISIDEQAQLPIKNAGMCYSVVCDRPEMAIMEYYDIDFDGKDLVIHEKVYKPKGGIHYSPQLAQGMYKWFEGLMNDTFKG